MNPTHDPEAALHELLALPDSDPRRAALLRDPALKAMYDNYRAFLAEDGIHVPLMDRADAALTALREREIERVGRSHADSFWARLFAPALRPAWGIAAILVVTGVWFALQPRTPSAPVLRGGGSSALEVLPVRATPAGVVLTWRRVSEADAYAVVLYAGDLTEIATLDAAAETTLLVPADRLPARGEDVLYRVVARGLGDELARSAIGTLPR